VIVIDAGVLPWVCEIVVDARIARSIATPRLSAFEVEVLGAKIIKPQTALHLGAHPRHKTIAYVLAAIGAGRSRSPSCSGNLVRTRLVHRSQAAIKFAQPIAIGCGRPPRHRQARGSMGRDGGLRYPRRQQQTYGLIFIIVVPPRVVAEMKPHARAEVDRDAGPTVMSPIPYVVVVNITTVV
jgi:hypothetical protein